MTRSWKKVTLLLIATLAALTLLRWATLHPSNDRHWQRNQAVLAYATFDGPLVHIRNVRNTAYITADDYTVRHYDKTFDLRKLETAWYGVVPFSTAWRGPAHTFVSFGFEGGDYVAVSVEVRKEESESYSPTRGLLRQFEVIYVIADERDVIRLRTDHYDSDVYLYPVLATRDGIEAMFVGMLERANRLREEPQFYNTLFNNCTTNIVQHVNEVAKGRVPFSLKTVFPGYSDELAYDLGLLDTELSLDGAREQFRINERARRATNGEDFSIRIRDFQ